MATNPVNKDDPAYVGNEFFVQKKYSEALGAYSTAIEKFPDMTKLYSNRALTYLKLNRPFDALKDTEAGLKIEPNDVKLIFRKCTALLEMRRFPEAAQFLDEGLKRIGQIPERYEKEFKTLIDDMNRLKTEFVEGRYDIMAMFEDSKKSPIVVKHADFYAWNKFEIREIDGKGRGLVAKEKIELGELLIACEAFAFVTLPESGSVYDTLRDEVRQNLSNRPDLAQQFYRLYAGPQLGHLDNWTAGESELVDLERIVSIIRYNHYEDGQVIVEGSTAPDPPLHFGVAFVPSFINHTCVDFNIARYFVGNYTFIRATRVIEKGEELVFSYLSPGASLKHRQRLFERDSFECRCRLCNIERQYSCGIKKRLEEIEQYLNGLAVRSAMTRTRHRPNDVHAMERIMEELRGYRPGLTLDYTVIRIREMIASDVAVAISDTEAKTCIPMWKELIVELKSGGDFIEALHMTKVLLKSAVRNESQREQDACDELARGIAKMFYDDERVADLHHY